MTRPSQPIRPISHIDQHIGARMKALREVRGLTPVALAAALGIELKQLLKYELGFARIDPARFFEIAQALDVEITDFFDGLQA